MSAASSRTLALAVAASASIVAFGGPAVAQEADGGRAAFAPCAACHAVDGGNGIGPSLAGVFDRPAGAVAGFRYSRALKRPGLVWDEASLDAFIADPQQVAPGNTMPYSGLPDAAQRAAVVAYLRTLSPAPAH